jgi:hypothetical protein
MLTSKSVYFLNGVAYDFYSIDELNNRSGPGLQWKIFPLPNEQISGGIPPWAPQSQGRNQATSIYISPSPQTSTGLSFVDHIYITGAPSLTDRRADLEKMFARYQITNYEWRMKWTLDTFNSPENKEEVYRKLNVMEKYLLSKIRFILLVSSLYQLLIF